MSVDRMRTSVVLPAPFGPSSATTATFGHLKVDTPECVRLAERPGDPLDFDNRVHACTSFGSATCSEVTWSEDGTEVRPAVELAPLVDALERARLDVAAPECA